MTADSDGALPRVKARFPGGAAEEAHEKEAVAAEGRGSIREGGRRPDGSGRSGRRRQCWSNGLSRCGARHDGRHARRCRRGRWQERRNATTRPPTAWQATGNRVWPMGRSRRSSWRGQSSRTQKRRRQPGRRRRHTGGRRRIRPRRRRRRTRRGRAKSAAGRRGPQHPGHHRGEMGD